MTHQDTKAPRALDGGVDPSEGSTLRIEVRACLTSDGRMWSTHEPASPDDERVQLTWPGGGHRHVAHALLTEAVRREAFVCLMIALSRDPELTAKLQEATPEEEASLISLLAKDVGGSLAANLGPMILPSVKEALLMVKGQQILSPKG